MPQAQRDDRLAESAIEMDAVAPVHPMIRDGVRHLVFEVLLHNRSSQASRVTSAEVHFGERVERIHGDSLRARFVGLRDDPSRASGLRRVPVQEGPLLLGSDGRALLYFWQEADLDVELPPVIQVTVNWVTQDRPMSAMTSVSVQARPLTVLTPPVEGGGWVAFMAPHNGADHRRSVYAVPGGLRAAQRFAIDLVRVDGEGQRFRGDSSVPENYLSHGSPVIAVASGTVVSVTDNIPDSVPGRCLERHLGEECGASAEPLTRDTVAGNTIVLALGDGSFAVYAHLLGGSVEVVEGQDVTSGQTLAHIGNSGNTTEPHLHFHLCDGPSPLECNGLPYAFDSFVSIPLDPRRGPTGPPRSVEGEMPNNWDLLAFPQRGD